eukprot:CAMPEP_0182418392 /NCGR_PEP_ID=MMETSP1167-20130531/2838_1 /TAXON_ID=2988 /ORGANISM="Mallomonas Sp, Strain CCMP3275" /LENGTH=275 /DNA_ID=CAMNT_0024592585 /DNA_START=573 /DNA_END=1400 /DNA_ORIENTATION=-
MTAQVGDMEIEWIGGVIFASVVIAAVVATVAFWIMFRLLSLNPSIESLRVASALVMGIAACGMHYTGMYSAVYHYQTKSVATASTITSISASLGCLVAGILVSIFIIILIMADNRIHYTKVSRTVEKYERLITEMEAGTSPELRVFVDRFNNSRITSCNTFTKNTIASQSLGAGHGRGSVNSVSHVPAGCGTTSGQKPAARKDTPGSARKSTSIHITSQDNNDICPTSAKFSSIVEEFTSDNSDCPSNAIKRWSDRPLSPVLEGSNFKCMNENKE